MGRAYPEHDEKNVVPKCERRSDEGFRTRRTFARLGIVALTALAIALVTFGGYAAAAPADARAGSSDDVIDSLTMRWSDAQGGTDPHGYVPPVS